MLPKKIFFDKEYLGLTLINKNNLNNNGKKHIIHFMDLLVVLTFLFVSTVEKSKIGSIYAFYISEKKSYFDMKIFS